MRIKAKLRRIGNSMGVILPADVITGYNLGKDIELDVITSDANVITDSCDACKKITREISQEEKPVVPHILPGHEDTELSVTVKSVKDSHLAPDGHPIQHANSMMVGYVPPA